MGRINVADATPKQVMQDIEKIAAVSNKHQIEITSTMIQHIWEVYSIENGKTWVRAVDMTDDAIKQVLLERL